MKHVVMFSGGAGSWATAKRVVERHGAADVVLLFADTMMEDEDLYRFIGEAASNVGAPLETDVIYLGIDWTETHRITRIQERVKPWKYEAPMTTAPYLSKRDVLEWMKRERLCPPRLYAMGFPHNNCGGFCVKAGQAQFERLLRMMPERYAWHEAQEEATREIQRQHGIVPSTVLYHRRGQSPGETRTRVTMREFRESIEKQPDLFDRHDWGGCGCAVDDAPPPDQAE